MTRQEHLAFCKKCLNRKMSRDQGLICGITDKIADFEESCENFKLDESVKEQVSSYENHTESEIPHTERVSMLSEDVKDRFIEHQDLAYAMIGGLFLSIISALLWAIVTVSTGYQIGYMAIAIGLIVGFGVRFFGAGIEMIYGVIGALCSLLACLLGNLFSQIGFMADAQSLGYFETLLLLDVNTIVLLFQETFSPIDLLFYGLAVYEGYRFAFRPVPENANTMTDFTPDFAKLRLPLVVICFLILSFASFSLSQGVNGEQTFYYESGAVMSKGSFKDGKESGLWNYYYENGNKQVTASYENGIENGEWIWYTEQGKVIRKGTFVNGLTHGTWLNYNEKGVLVDSSNYHEGRLHGESRSFYDNGNLLQFGEVERDRQVGLWKVYNEDGSISSIGEYDKGEPSGLWRFSNKNGNLIQEVTYLKEGKLRIENAWDNRGRQTVTGGNGVLKSFDSEGNLFLEGKVKAGKKTGEWKSYHKNGKIKEIGVFENDQYKLMTAWDNYGGKIIENGNGEYFGYSEANTGNIEKGIYKDGLREGKWVVYFPDSDQILSELNYTQGKLNGRNTNYNVEGQVLSEGDFENGKRTGEWKWYYESGVLQCTVTYENDLKEGDQIFWSESGMEAKKETYENGELINEVLL